jgi:hypothetical protein
MEARQVRLRRRNQGPQAAHQGLGRQGEGDSFFGRVLVQSKEIAGSSTTGSFSSLNAPRLRWFLKGSMLPPIHGVHQRRRGS